MEISEAPDYYDHIKYPMGRCYPANKRNLAFRGELIEKQIFRPQALYRSALPMTYNEAVKVALLRWFRCLWFITTSKTKLQVLFDSKVSTFLANEENDIK